MGKPALHRDIALWVAWLAASATALAQAPQTLWLCAYTGGNAPYIACMLATAGRAADTASQPAHVRGLAARIRRDPASLDDEVILIPMHAPPIDRAFSERLARSVMCGGYSPGCRVQFVERIEGPR